MSAPRLLLVLLLLAACPRLVEAQRSLTSSCLGGWWDEQALAVLPIHRHVALNRAGGGIADEVSAARFAAERVRRIPTRPPFALPGEGFQLFAPEALRPERERADAVELDDAATVAPLPEAAAPVTAASPAAARTGRVQARAETVYYEVEGLTRSAIAAALREHGPNVHGRQFFGLTEWEMSAGYRPAEGGAGCAIDGLTVQVEVTTHLPQWPGAVAAPEALRGAWDRFLTALDRHERGHRVLAESAAEAVRRRLLTVSASTCDRLDGAAQREMATVMREYEARQLAYDAETGHGRTQGAVWPPAHAPHFSAHRAE